jgi:hypothetical protein
MLQLLLSWKMLGLLAALLAIACVIAYEAHDHSVFRPATRVEKKQVKQAMTGWASDFAKHK